MLGSTCHSGVTVLRMSMSGTLHGASAGPRRSWPLSLPPAASSTASGLPVSLSFRSAASAAARCSALEKETNA